MDSHLENWDSHLDIEILVDGSVQLHPLVWLEPLKMNNLFVPESIRAITGQVVAWIIPAAKKSCTRLSCVNR